MNKFDMMVIGSGSGLEISSEAAERGLSVAVVGEGAFGGTCLNRGCIPSKMLIHSADVMETIRTAERFGIRAKVEGIDWQSMIRRVADEVDGDSQAIEAGNRQAPNITVFKGSGRFVSEKTLEVNGEELSAETIVIGAGARPREPNIKGISDVPYVTSDEALRLPRQPQSLTILGGGYIAAEMGHFFGALGTDVTIIQRGPLLVQQEDRDISHRFTEVYKRRFRLLLNARVTEAHRNGDKITVEVSRDGQTETIGSDSLLIASGRIPNADLLDVTRTGVDVDQGGGSKWTSTCRRG